MQKLNTRVTIHIQNRINGEKLNIAVLNPGGMARIVGFRMKNKHTCM